MRGHGAVRAEHLSPDLGERGGEEAGGAEDEEHEDCDGGLRETRQVRTPSLLQAAVQSSLDLATLQPVREAAARHGGEVPLPVGEPRTRPIDNRQPPQGRQKSRKLS